MEYSTLICQLLIIANKRLNYSIYISDYPKKHGLNFNPSSGIDNFYKDVCNVFFNDSLLITATLMDADSRCISFYNWKEFISQEDQKLRIEEIKNKFNKFGLKEFRDQIVGHIDKNNPNNRFPIFRIQSIINKKFIKNLEYIQKELIDIFHKYTKLINRPYQSIYTTAENVNGIDKIMNTVKPQMTTDFVI